MVEPPSPVVAPNAVQRPSQRGGVCATCGQRFSSDARFCPFDGELLVLLPASGPLDPLLGSVLDGRYEVLQVLGEGGMGTVYRARHSKLGRQFAIKVLRVQLASDADLSKRFIREAKAAAAVAHPNVVQICDFGELPTGQPYFVMELLEGMSLSHMIWRRGPTPPGTAIRILRQVAEGLSAAHAAGIVHRDLKPDNIHITEIGGREVVKVLDFGLAKVAGASKLTKNGIVYGTPHYMSPEQAAGEGVDHRTDVYALGVVMYETLTGQVPFDADTYMGILSKHLYVQAIPPSQLLGTSELGALEDVTLRCLEKRPGKRYASMAELLAAFDRIVEVSGSGQIRVRSAAARAPVKSVLASEHGGREAAKGVPSRRRVGLRGVALGVLFGALGATGWLVWAALRAPTTGVAPPVTRLEPAVAQGVEPDVRPVESPSTFIASSSAGLDAGAAKPASATPAPRAPARPAKAARGPGPAPNGVKAISPRNQRPSGGEIIDPWAK